METPYSDSAEYFVCEKFKCTMMKVRCVQRQNKKEEGWGRLSEAGSFVAFPGCRNCDQGQNIKTELEQMRGIVKDMASIPNQTVLRL